MSRLKVSFGQPEHGWIDFSVFYGEEQVVKCDASDIYPSFDELVKALSEMLKVGGKQLVTWAEEPAETELLFSRCGEEDVIQLEVAFFETSQNPRKKRKSNLRFIGTYEEICLPFWRALQDLKSGYAAKVLESEWHWTGNFPIRELDLLTNALGKSK